jgi:hypothetical protein
MRVTLVRSGGFAGLQRTAAVDGAALPQAERHELDALVAGAGFHALPPTLSAPAPDRFRYRLTVEDDAGRVHTVVVDEAAMTDRLRALVAWVEARGRP